MITIRSFNKSCEIGVDSFSPTVFVDNCNYSCDYCMNAKLVRREVKQQIDIKDVKKFVEENKCKLIIISGGEPLLQSVDDLSGFIQEFNSIGCGVGICTNGYWVLKLEKLIDKLNYVAMDLKTDPTRYTTLTKQPNAYNNVLHCADILFKNRDTLRWNRELFDYEIRTTLYPPLVDEESVRKMSLAIYRGEKWVWQNYRPTPHMLNPSVAELVKPYSQEKIEELKKIAEGEGHHIIMRDV